MVKTIYWIQHTHKNRHIQKWKQRWKSIVQINENVIYGKTMKNMRNWVDVKLVNNKKDYLKYKPRLYVTQNICL